MTRRVPSQPPDLPGYDYVSLLGSGGFSDVFLYDQRLPRRKVAVKVLLTEQLNPKTRSRFVDEANVMAQLSAHPYIVTIYHADVAADDRPFFVMEYYSGPSLADQYKHHPFDVEDALRTGVRLSSAIATAHSAGILHRDVKPANVLTNAFGWPALTDFGISSALEDELPVHITTTTAHLRAAEASESTGTSEQQSVGLSVPWSPPEMFEDNPLPDVRSDVFSLSATIYTLLAGRTPFEIPGRSNGTLDLIGRIERGAITQLERTDVPRSLVAVLQKGMATKPANRFASAVDFARALQRVELEIGYAPTSIDVPNLAVVRAERSQAESGEDETRVRSLATIVAQPAPPVARAQNSPTPPETEEESTRMRGAVPVVEPTEHTVLRPHRTPHSAPKTTTVGGTGEHEESADGPRRRGLFIGIVTAAVVLVGAGIAAAVLVPQAAPSPVNSGGVNPGPNPSNGGIDVSDVPDALVGTVTRSVDGTSVTFVWKNPKPKAGDSYVWTQEGSTKPPTSTPKAQAVIDSLTAGADVCIDVVIIRDGRSSANPIKECTS